MLRRFDREARSLAKLSHPNIIKVFDFGQYHTSREDEFGAPYLVMDYLPGGTLKELVGEPMPYTDAAACWSRWPADLPMRTMKA
jgi:serine/threonine-protein kinase